MESDLIEKSKELYNENVKSKTLKRHCLEVAAIMREMASVLEKDEDEWYYTGLLHDLDYDEIKDPKTHGLKTAEILKKENYPEEMINAILAHNENNGNKRKTELDYFLSSADNISGLIHAYALMRGGILGMKTKGLKKKMKSKAFAASINRELITDIEKFMDLNKFIEMSIKGMGKIEKDTTL